MRVPLPRVARAVVMASVLAGCQASQPQIMATGPTARNEWSSTLLQSRDEVTGGRYGVADRLLVDFAARYPASAEASEALYWRALYKLDPANASGSSREAAALLDSYLAGGHGARFMEAQALRRIVGALETRAAASTVGTPAPGEKPRTAADDKAKDDELQRVKEELAKANAELERIKRRLAKP